MTEASPLQRVRHEIRRRTLDVLAVEDLGPNMRRVRLGSPQLRDFVSASPDDHIKLFFPAADGGTESRDYTPRAFDTAAGELVVDFALHGATPATAGPATAWALAARPGDTLEIAGPRGSVIVPDRFDWYLLIGDETALPAIGRRVEELRAGVPATTIVLVDDDADIQAFATRAAWDGRWLHRDRIGDALAATLQAVDQALPAKGDGFVWLAGEAMFARALRGHLIDVRGLSPHRVKAAGYWVKGGTGAHQPLD